MRTGKNRYGLFRTVAISSLFGFVVYKAFEALKPEIPIELWQSILAFSVLGLFVHALNHKNRFHHEWRHKSVE
jgi:hypothetical protein